MKLTKFKEKNHKKIGIILFTICCVLLVTIVFLYKSFALFTTNERKNIIKGNVEDMGDLYFNFYVNDTLQKEMPTKESGLVLDEGKSYCGVSGKKDNNIKVSLTNDYVVQVSGMTSLNTKCNLYFTEKLPLSDVTVVEKGSGLYKIANNLSGWEKPELRYAGSSASVNNYVDFNGEKWRIIGLVNVQTTSGAITQRLKIIKADAYQNLPWDSKSTNNWTNASLQETLNGEYLNNIDPTFKSMIATDINWNIGESNVFNGITTNQYYEYERGDTVYSKNPSTWDGEVGLMYLSDYGYATSGGENHDRTACLNQALYSWDNGNYLQDCVGNNWLLNVSSPQWTLVPYSEVSDVVFCVYTSGYGEKVSTSLAVRPVVYLASNVRIDGGSGKEDDSFQLSQ